MKKTSRTDRYQESFGALYSILERSPHSAACSYLRPFLRSIGLRDTVNINLSGLIHILNAEEMNHVLTVIETASCQRAGESCFSDQELKNLRKGQHDV